MWSQPPTRIGLSSVEFWNAAEAGLPVSTGSPLTVSGIPPTFGPNAGALSPGLDGVVVAIELLPEFPPFEPAIGANPCPSGPETAARARMMPAATTPTSDQP